MNLTGPGIPTVSRRSRWLTLSLLVVLRADAPIHTRNMLHDELRDRYHESSRWRSVMGVPRSRRGEAAVPFELRDHQNRRYTLEDFAGSWLLLVFHRHLA